MRRHFWGLIIVSVISYWTIKPLLQTGYFTMHDDTQVARVIVMGKAIRNGQFPVRWVSDLGYGFGYPLYNFYGPLPYYFGGTLYALGVDAVAATKTMMTVGMVLAGITIYALVQARYGRLSGILAGILYAYAPYHAVQLYVRGAVGELWAYAFLPLLFVRSNPWIGGLGLAGIILSHTITGYVTVVFYGIGLVVYSATLYFKKQFHILRLRSYVLRLVIGLGLSAFFWLPATLEMGYTSVAGQVSATANFRDHFVCIPQLWNSLWGYGGSAAGCIDGMSFKIGKLHIVLAIVGVVLGFSRVRLFAVTGLASVFMVLGISRGIWEILPGFAFVQYPWRLFMGVALSASVLGAGVLFRIKHKWMKLSILTLLLTAIVLFNAKLFTPQMIYDKPAGFFESEEELAWRVSKVSDEYLPPSVQKPATKELVRKTILSPDRDRGLFVETEIDTGVYAKLHVQTAQPMDVVLNRVYFPGWQYWVNGVREVPRVEHGLSRLSLPKDRSVVEMRFGNTPVRVIGNVLALAVVFWFLKAYGKKNIA